MNTQGSIPTQKLTPCFKLSLAWSAISDRITKAAATQRQNETERAWINWGNSLAMTQQLGPYRNVRYWKLINHMIWFILSSQRSSCRFTLSVLVFLRIRREVVQIIWRKQNKDMKWWPSDYLDSTLKMTMYAQCTIWVWTVTREQSVWDVLPLSSIWYWRTLTMTCSSWCFNGTSDSSGPLVCAHINTLIISSNIFNVTFAHGYVLNLIWKGDQMNLIISAP